MDQREYLSRFRVTAELELGEDQLAIDRDLKGPSSALYQLYSGFRVVLANFGCQTGSPGLVVSNHAILDSDLHHGPPSFLPAS